MIERTEYLARLNSWRNEKVIKMLRKTHWLADGMKATASE